MDKVRSPRIFTQACDRADVFVNQEHQGSVIYSAVSAPQVTALDPESFHANRNAVALMIRGENGQDVDSSNIAAVAAKLEVEGCPE